MTAPRRLRVLHLGSPTGLYGAERWIMALTKHLPPDIESIVGVIKDAPGPMPPLCELAAEHGLATRVFESKGKLSFSAISQLREFIRHRQIDIIHTHGYKTDLIGYFATRGTDCKTVSTPHGWSMNAGMKLQIYETLDRMIFPFLDAVVPLSMDLHQELGRLPGIKKRLHLIRNGVDLSDIDSVLEPSNELKEIKARGVFVIGYIGQLIPRKGIDTLIRAFSALPVTDKQLCLIGEGPQKTELQRLAESLGVTQTVRFFGYRDDRIALLKGFDVFVLPSALEGIPRCLLEAMAAEVAIVASDIPGCRVLVEEAVTGFLFEVGDQVGLTKKLTALMVNPDIRGALAAAGEHLVRAEFSAETMARRYAELYCGLVPGKGYGDAAFVGVHAAK